MIEFDNNNFSNIFDFINSFKGPFIDYYKMYSIDINNILDDTQIRVSTVTSDKIKDSFYNFKDFSYFMFGQKKLIFVVDLCNIDANFAYNIPSGVFSIEEINRHADLIEAFKTIKSENPENIFKKNKDLIEKHVEEYNFANNKFIFRFKSLPQRQIEIEKAYLSDWVLIELKQQYLNFYLKIYETINETRVDQIDNFVKYRIKKANKKSLSEQNSSNTNYVYKYCIHCSTIDYSVDEMESLLISKCFSQKELENRLSENRIQLTPNNNGQNNLRIEVNENENEFLKEKEETVKSIFLLEESILKLNTRIKFNDYFYLEEKNKLKEDIKEIKKEKDNKILELEKTLNENNSICQKLTNSLNEKLLVIENNEKELEKRDKKIFELEKTLNENNSFCKKMTDSLKEMQLLIENSDKEIEKRNIKISEMEKTFIEKDSLCKKTTDSLKEMQIKKEISENELNKKDMKIIELEKNLMKKNNSLYDFENALKSKEIEIDNLKNKINIQISDFFELKTILSSKILEIKNLTSKLIDKSTEIEELQMNFNSKLKEINSTLNSKEQEIKILNNLVSIKESKILNFQNELSIKNLNIETLQKEINEKNCKLKILEDSFNIEKSKFE